MCMKLAKVCRYEYAMPSASDYGTHTSPVVYMELERLCRYEYVMPSDERQGLRPLYPTVIGSLVLALDSAIGCILSPSCPTYV